MTNADKQIVESSEEQIAWDKRSRRYWILVMSVLALFLGSALGAIIWTTMTHVVPTFDLLNSDVPTDSDEFRAAQSDGGKALTIVFLVFLATLIAYWPLRFFARYMDFKLGRRPPVGGWVPYPYKSIDMTLEKISDTEQVAVVDKYKFKIVTRLDRHLIGSDTLSIQISEVNDNDVNFVTGHLNLDVVKFTDEWIANSISKILEDHTDYFMEYNYSI